MPFNAMCFTRKHFYFWLSLFQSVFLLGIVGQRNKETPSSVAFYPLINQNALYNRGPPSAATSTTTMMCF